MRFGSGFVERIGVYGYLRMVGSPGRRGGSGCFIDGCGRLLDDGRGLVLDSEIEKSAANDCCRR